MPNIPSVRDLLDLTGRAVIVTGGTSGIGRGIAARFAEAGAAVVVHYRSSAAAAAAVVERIQSNGGNALAIQADVTRPEEVDRLVAQTVEALGRLDVLVNNAGTYPLASLVEMTPEQWDEVVDSNLRNVFLCTQAAARRMLAQGDGGAIVNIASIEGLGPMPAHSHYDAAKAGVIMLTRAAAQELGPHGIRVNAVSPGLIWREGIEQQWPEGVARWQARVPLARLGRPEDIADACLFLASPAARWITGVNLVVDGGVTTAPLF